VFFTSAQTSGSKGENCFLEEIKSRLSLGNVLYRGVQFLLSYSQATKLISFVGRKTWYVTRRKELRLKV